MYRVVVIEDEENIRKGFIKNMDWLAHGCEVVGQAANGRDGLALIREAAPDIVFTDIKMPVMDGLAMLEHARQEAQFEAVVLSGYGEFSYAKRAIKIGVSDFVLKPFETEAISSTLSGIVKRLDAKKQGTQPGAALTLPDGASHYTRRGYEYILQSYHQGITGADVAKKLEISPGYFYKLFKKDTGESIHHFLLKLRLSKAAELLIESPGLKVYEVSDMVGFGDYKQFHRVFSEMYGMSPLKYRAEATKNNQAP